MLEESVASQFRGSLKSLTDVLADTAPAFIRCVKPNHDKAARRFDGGAVRRQLRAAGMLETVRIRQQGFALREDHAHFFARHRFLAPRAKNVGELVGALSRLLRVSRGDWQIGHTKLFLKTAIARKLSALVVSRLRAAARAAQRAWRARRARLAAGRVQRHWRVRRAVARSLRSRAAARGAQRVARGRAARRRCARARGGDGRACARRCRRGAALAAKRAAAGRRRRVGRRRRRRRGRRVGARRRRARRRGHRRGARARRRARGEQFDRCAPLERAAADARGRPTPALAAAGLGELELERAAGR